MPSRWYSQHMNTALNRYPATKNSRNHRWIRWYLIVSKMLRHIRPTVPTTAPTIPKAESTFSPRV